MDFTINTINTDDPYTDAVQNMVYLFNQHKRELGLREVYDEDLERIPAVPSVVVTWDKAEEEIRNLSHSRSNILVQNRLEIWYYHEQIETNVRKKEIVAKLNEIAFMLRKHRSINGFCENLMATINDVEYLPRIRENGIMGAGIINITVPRSIKVENPD